MFRRRYLWGFLAALLALGLLVGAGFAVGRLAWWQGYQMGRLTQGNGEGQPWAPGLPYGPGSLFRRPHLAFWPALFGLSALFRVGLLVLLFIGIAKLFHLWGRRAACDPSRREAWAEYWAKRWHRHHPPGPHPGWQGQSGPDAEGEGAEDSPQE
jgi:hypothetical protein